MCAIMGDHYRHDCEHCVRIGSIKLYEHQAYDVWVCPGQGELIVRNGDEGGDYGSLPLALLERGRVTQPKWLAAFNLYNMHAEAEYARLSAKQAARS